MPVQHATTDSDSKALTGTSKKPRELLVMFAHAQIWPPASASKRWNANKPYAPALRTHATPAYIHAYWGSGILMAPTLKKSDAEIHHC